MEKYKPGQILTYKPHNAVVTVIHNSLGPGGTNGGEAFVTIRMANGFLQNVPVEVQAEYLTTAPPVKIPFIQKVFGTSK